MASQITHISMDKFGRVVVPKELRERLGLRPGIELEVEERDDVILLRPVFKKAKVVNRNGWLVVDTGQPVTQEMANEVIEKSRREDR